MGYNKEHAKMYAKMAMNHQQGLAAVLKSIDQENVMKSQQLAEQRMQEEKQTAQEQMQEIQHQNTIEQISCRHHKLNLLTYIALFLFGFIAFGMELLFLRKR